jgi:hypothetical protein
METRRGSPLQTNDGSVYRMENMYHDGSVVDLFETLQRLA